MFCTCWFSTWLRPIFCTEYVRTDHFCCKDWNKSIWGFYFILFLNDIFFFSYLQIHLNHLEVLHGENRNTIRHIAVLYFQGFRYLYDDKLYLMTKKDLFYFEDKDLASCNIDQKSRLISFMCFLFPTLKLHKHSMKSRLALRSAFLRSEKLCHF